MSDWTYVWYIYGFGNWMFLYFHTKFEVSSTILPGFMFRHCCSPACSPSQEPRFRWCKDIVFWIFHKSSVLIFGTTGVNWKLLLFYYIILYKLFLVELGLLNSALVPKNEVFDFFSKHVPFLFARNWFRSSIILLTPKHIPSN